MRELKFEPGDKVAVVGTVELIEVNKYGTAYKVSLMENGGGTTNVWLKEDDLHEFKQIKGED